MAKHTVKLADNINLEVDRMRAGLNEAARALAVPYIDLLTNNLSYEFILHKTDELPIQGVIVSDEHYLKLAKEVKDVKQAEALSCMPGTPGVRAPHIRMGLYNPFSYADKDFDWDAAFSSWEPEAWATLTAEHGSKLLKQLNPLQMRIFGLEVFRRGAIEGWPFYVRDSVARREETGLISVAMYFIPGEEMHLIYGASN